MTQRDTDTPQHHDIDRCRFCGEPILHNDSSLKGDCVYIRDDLTIVIEGCKMFCSEACKADLFAQGDSD